MLSSMTNPLQGLISKASEIEAKLGYTFKDKHLLGLAFVHRSFVNEFRYVTPAHNERLEFLGDSVLNLLMADFLYKTLPENSEGDLSHLRSRLVEGPTCMRYIQKLQLEPYLLLGRGEKMNDGRGRATILSDLFESLVGAIYLDGGFEEARAFIFGHFLEEIESIIEGPLCNWKATLQDFAQKKFNQAPEYKVLSATGPDHSKTFTVSVQIQEKEVGHGVGSSKKEAQQAAARMALEHLMHG